MASGFKIKVEAKTLADAVQAYGILHTKTRSGSDLKLYTLIACHGGAFSAAWAACSVDISVIAAAITVAENARELAAMTLPDDCHTKCTGRIEVWSVKTGALKVEGFSVKRRFGCKRDLVETLTRATTIPLMSDFLLAPCTIMRCSALAADAKEFSAHWGPTVEWDVCPSLPSIAPACFSRLPDCPVEESVGLFYLSKASTS